LVVLVFHVVALSTPQRQLLAGGFVTQEVQKILAAHIGALAGPQDFETSTSRSAKRCVRHADATPEFGDRVDRVAIDESRRPCSASASKLPALGIYFVVFVCHSIRPQQVDALSTKLLVFGPSSMSGNPDADSWIENEPLTSWSD
jgi:hypothetical protein